MKSPILPPTDPLFPPACNTLSVDSFNGLPPSWRWSVGVTTSIPGRAAIGKPGDDDHEPPVPQQDTYTELRAGNDSMTEKEWEGWTSQPTDAYVLSVAAAHLNLQLA